jgi:hypothetical protein
VRAPEAKRPKGTLWRLERTETMPNTIGLSLHYVSPKLRVVSSLDLAELPDGSGEVGPQWHVSISARRKRPKDSLVRLALRDFGLVGAEEDNHHPGVARHFWMAVDPARRSDCECKVTEEVITERDGYRWTNPTDAPCRGCEYERRFGRACPIHARAPKVAS